MKTQKRQKSQTTEMDSVYVLKLVMYLIIGTLWLRIGQANGNTIPLPIGLVVGLVFAAHDHFKIDRKIEFAVLLVAMLIGFWSQIGFILTF
jgi:hypothetical protein